MRSPDSMIPSFTLTVVRRDICEKQADRARRPDRETTSDVVLPFDKSTIRGYKIHSHCVVHLLERMNELRCNTVE